VSWDGSPGRFTDEQYARSCVLDRGPSVESVKERYSLPVREPDGTLNCDAVSAAKGRIGQVKGASAEQIASARAKLDRLAAQCEKRSRPLGEFEERQLELSTDGQRIRGVVPYGTLSVDLGGWREVIEPTALRSTRLDDLVVTVDHVGLPLGRYPRTLELEDRADGMHWSVDPPASRADVIEAVQRGDLRGGSWRMKVARDEWRGDVRHVHEIAELRDVSIVTHPSYPAAAVELRSQEEPPMPETVTAPEASESPPEPVEARSIPDPTPESPRPPAGSLRVESRSGGDRPLTLAGCFRSRGFPSERVAEIPWQEFEERAVTWSASVDVMNQMRRIGVPLPLDQRYAWPAFPRVGVDASATSVLVVQQVSRALASAANVVRNIDATTAKPETGSTINVLTVSLHQVANIQTNVPNIYMLQDAVNSIIEQDLRLAINECLDKLVLDAIATAGFHAPTTEDTFTSVRKCITTLQGLGFNPDTLILTPAAAESLDLSKATTADSFYQFAPDFAPGSIFGLSRRISKTIPAPAIIDSSAFGKLYASPVTLARFEASNGTTNSANIRMELNATFGVERVGAALRIAAS
jgi:HK97 family phage prohead protease